MPWFGVFNLVIGLMCLAVAGYASRWRNLSASTPLALLLLLASSSCITQGFIIVSVSQNAKIVWMTWHYMLMSLMPVVWLRLVRAVTGLPVRIPMGVAPFILGFTIISALLILTNSAHHLIFSDQRLLPGRMLLQVEFGSFFNIFAVVNYAELILGMVLLVRRWQLERGARRSEMVLWLLCVILPTVPDLATFIFPQTFKDLEPAPLLLAVTSMLAAWGLVSRRVLLVEPVALEVVC
jgi:hypothetical protein